MEICYHQDPGYLNDVYFIFYFKMNPDICLRDFPCGTPSMILSDQTHYKNAVEPYLHLVSERCRLFFYGGTGRKCFMTTHYFDPILSLSEALSALHNAEVVSQQVFEYFMETTDQLMSQSLRQLIDRVEASDYEADIKVMLLHFFAHPQVYVSTLIRDLNRVHQKLTAYYAEHQSQLEKCKRDINIDELAEFYLSGNEQSKDDIYAWGRINYSFSLLHKNFVCLSITSHTMILGNDFKNRIPFIRNSLTVNLVDFGKCIGDERRYQILEFVRDHGEARTMEIASQWTDISKTITYYHLEHLTKVGLLSTRTQGRTVYYSLNRQFFSRVSQLLKTKFDEEDELHESSKQSADPSPAQSEF